MALVIGAFSTLVEAERAAAALLESGFGARSITAIARAGGGRLLLAGRVGVQPVGEPARLVNRTERAGGAAFLGAVAGAGLVALAFFALPRVGLDVFAAWRPFIATPLLLAATMLAGALLTGLIVALVRPARGLPGDLAFRYALRLDQGDTVMAVATTATTQARSVQETLVVHGATQAHVTRGSLEALGAPPLPTGLAPSRN